jgi:hypothetical protein
LKCNGSNFGKAELTSNLKIAFLKKAIVKIFLLSFFLADEKEFNITFLFAKERCQNPIFTFFCRATKESETKEKCLCPRFAKLAMYLLRFREW